MSELIREALRHYARRSYVLSTWDDVNAHGRAKAERRGIREQDVDGLVHRASTRTHKRVAKK